MRGKNTLLARDDVVRDDVVLEVLLRRDHLRPDAAAADRGSGVSTGSLDHLQTLSQTLSLSPKRNGQNERKKEGGQNEGVVHSQNLPEKSEKVEGNIAFPCTTNTKDILNTCTKEMKRKGY